MLYTLLAIYGGIGLVSTIIVIAVCVRKGQTNHLARPPKPQPNITVVPSALHRKASTESPPAGQHRTYVVVDSDDETPDIAETEEVDHENAFPVERHNAEQVDHRDGRLN